jgi:hypothetical protein
MSHVFSPWPGLYCSLWAQFSIAAFLPFFIGRWGFLEAGLIYCSSQAAARNLAVYTLQMSFAECRLPGALAWASKFFDLAL